jgi:hypothetical protein
LIGDEALAVVEEFAGFIAEEVGIEVDAAVAVAGFGDETVAAGGFSDFVRGGIEAQDDMGSQGLNGSVGTPSLLADFHGHAHPIHFYDKRPRRKAGTRFLKKRLARPRHKPPRLIKDAIFGKLGFESEAEELSV